MAIDPTLISPVSALLGALVGGVASLLGAVHTQRSHDRVERVASEISFHGARPPSGRAPPPPKNGRRFMPIS
jgi:hypothetical protein